METNVWPIEQQNVVEDLEQAGKKLDPEQDPQILDFAAVRRIDSGGLRAIQDFAQRADEKKVKVVLRGVDVNVYKTLKLAHLTCRFSFVN